MWDTVIIGDGKKLCSAVRVFPYNNISENKYSYWITNVYLNMGMTIYKDTKEGKFISKLIDKQVKIDVFDAFIKKTFIKNASYKTISKLIDNIKDVYFEDGRESKREEFLSVLGIREF